MAALKFLKVFFNSSNGIAMFVSIERIKIKGIVYQITLRFYLIKSDSYATAHCTVHSQSNV